MPINKPRVVCIVGSTRFKNQHLGIAQRETLRGKIVLIAGFFHHVDMVPISDEQKTRLDELMFRKIDLADEIIVCNVNGYIGKTTQAGIEYARQHDKTVKFIEEPSGV